MQSVAVADTTTKNTRACESCYRAKAKCISQSGRESDKCLRCHRLQKQCTAPPQKPRKKRAPNVAATTAQLEQKIESLVALLSTGRVPVSSIGQSPAESQTLLDASQVKPNLGCPQEFPPQSEAISIPGKPVGHTFATQYAMHGTAALTPATSSAAEGSVTSDFDPREEHSDRLLQVFRDQFAVHVPYFLVAPDETPLGLQTSRPWLFRTVMMLACQDDRTRQIELGIQIARELTEAMLIRAERSMDMFQALAVFNSWSCYFSPVSPNTMSAGFMQLSIGMLSDLGLNRPARLEDCGPADVERWALNDHCPAENKRTLDERRALLYCYLLTSTSAHCIKKTEYLQSSPYLEYSCQVLLESAQNDSDVILVYCVKMQCFIESISRVVSETTESQVYKAPIWMHVASARTGLQNIWTSVPLSLRDNTILRIKYHSCEIFLYDPCLQKHLFPPSSNSLRLDMLYACLLSAKTFLDLILEQPLSIFFGLSIPSLSQMGHAISTLVKLSFVEEDGWNLANVRETINLGFYIGQFVASFEKAGALIDKAQSTPCKVSFPTGCSVAMRRVLAACEAKIAGESEPVGFQGQPGYSAMDETLSAGVAFERIDDAYWEAIIGDLTQ